ncbi:Uncharacterised protein [Mycobacteroides abscessus]|nr:hypothetical protein [Mycobacteroides abscessus]RRE04867.1 hypothetical protein D9R13_01345 [Mycobacteroides abscessus subsp. massiliense]RIS68934.1 hypothetical protein D2E70_18705 [Mycobacteroides abscessus]RIT51254.1 hypothetical protein D2E80_06660 [Mycobacteroides abscessus]CPU34115.1 Uncharacterised protein [Mycobacteroides abscessus]
MVVRRSTQHKSLDFVTSRLPERFTHIELSGGTDQLAAYMADLTGHLRRELNLAAGQEPPTSEVMRAIGAPVSEWYRQMLTALP